MQTQPILSNFNAHPRDAFIEFQEEGHKYTILTDPKSKYTSVTTWNHQHFPSFDAVKIIDNMMCGKKWKEGHKYWGFTSEEIQKQWADAGKDAASLGTQLHARIEAFMNRPGLAKGYTHKDLWEDYQKKTQNSPTSPTSPTPKKYNLRSNKTKTEEEVPEKEKEITEKEEEIPEWTQFLQFIQDTPTLQPYRTEWMIYHEELKLSGSIDMVYRNKDGTLSIYDWKRSKEISFYGFNEKSITPCIKHLNHSNYWHYALQLNTYRAILEAKYGECVTNLSLVKLHPNASSYECIPVSFLDKEINDLFDLQKNDLKEK